MLKRVAWLLAIISIGFFINTNMIKAASNGTCGSDLTWNLDDNGVLTISGSGEMDSYSSGAAVPWYSVRDSIKRLVVEDGVTSIGTYAFFNCSSIENVTLGKDITQIYRSAFGNCTNLRDFDFPEHMDFIGDSAFSNCTSLTTVVVPSEVSYLGSYAFQNCDSITSVYIPESVTSFGSRIFYECVSLRDVYFDSIESWLSMPRANQYDTPLYYGANLYFDNELATDIVIPAGTAIIPSYAFYNCSSITSVNIPYGVDSIGTSAFDSCSNLLTVNLPCSLDKLWYYAFRNCSRLSQITIPDSVRAIESGVFMNCKALENATILSKNAAFGSGVFSGTNESLLLYVLPKSTGIDYATNNSLSYELYSSSLSTEFICSTDADDTVAVLGYSGEGGIVEIPNTINGKNVTRIAAHAFENETTIISVTLPISVQKIGEYAFAGCTMLETINIPANVTEIPAFLFNNCSSLQVVSIPDSVLKIGDSAFANCISLDSITIPQAVTDLGSKIFSGNSHLRTINLRSYFPSIKQDTFSDCDTVDNIVTIQGVIHPSQSDIYGVCGGNAIYSVENGQLTIIGTGVINNYEAEYSSGYYYDIGKPTTPWFEHNINKVVVSDGIIDIGRRAFSTLPNVNEVSLPSTITTIRDEAFARCSSLVEITIPASAHYFENYIFEECRQLSTITFEGGAPIFGNCDFLNVTANVYYIPDRTWTNDKLSSHGGTLTWIKPSGTCGENVTWILDDIAELRIHGSGIISDASWQQFSTTITSLIIESDVLGMEDSVFATLPNLNQVIFEGDFPSMSANVFSSVSATVYYPHANATWSSDNQLNYGGILTWTPYCAHEGSTISQYEPVRYEETEPTDCTTNGWTAHWKCSICGSAFADESLTVLLKEEDFTIPATGHKLVTVEGFPATCTEPGLTDEVFCEICGETLQAQEEIPIIPHTDSISVAGVLPSCTHVGYTAEHRCSVCGIVLEEIQEIPMLEHTDSISKEAVEPTCSEVGYTAEHRCAVCGELLLAAEEIEKLPHTEQISLEAVEPTCTEPGHTEERTCSVCGEVLVASEEQPAIGHTYDEPVVTWTEDGHECIFAFACIHGDDVQEIAVQAMRSVALEPTCIDMGTSQYTAKVLFNGKEYEQNTTRIDIEATGHIPVEDAAVEPTDRVHGLTTGSHCSVCGEVLVPQEVIPALWSFTDDGMTVIAYNGSETELTIPEGTTTLSADLFKNNTSIISVYVPDTVTAIGAQSFYGATSLQDVWLPDNVNGIGTQTFFNTTAKLHADVSSFTARAISLRGKSFTDGDWTLRYKVSSLSSEPTAIYLIEWSGDASELIIPEQFAGVPLTQIQDGAVGGKMLLQEVYIPESVISIATNAFDGCSNEVKIVSAWNAPARSWATDNGFAWEHDHHTEELLPAIPATCTETGLSEGIVCSECGAVLQEQVVIDALGHDWYDPTYTWADDNSTLTAIHVCKHDETHTESETVMVSAQITKDATCTESGAITYTSDIFENALFSAQSKVEENVEPLGHKWLEPVYTWSEDNSTVTAVRVCERDSDHIEEETVSAYAEVTKPATCNEMGETTYTSTDFINHAFTVQSKVLTDIDIVGHEWLAPTYIWAADYSSVTASRVCAFDETHVESETVSAAYVVTKSPTESESGEFYYRSDAFANSAFSVQDIFGGTIPALGSMAVYNLPSHLTIIEEEAFDGLPCEAVIIPDGCTTIDSKAYADCHNLVYVYIPASVTNIAPDAFDGCEGVIFDKQ